MNKRVLQTFILLIWLVLAAFSVVKVFFGDWFAVQVSNEKIRAVGEFVDGHIFVRGFLYILFAQFTYFCYFCACKQCWNLSLKEHIVVLSANILLTVFSFVQPEATAILDIVFMVVAPVAMGSKQKQAAAVFVLHYVGQIMLLWIRSKTALLIGIDWATQFIFCFDAYLWLLLYYLYANLNKEETIWEECVRRFSAMARRKRSKPNSTN